MTKEELTKMIESGNWPEDCQFGNGIDGITVLCNRETLRREAGIVPKPQATSFGWQRRRVRLSCDANGKAWTTDNGG